MSNVHFHAPNMIVTTDPVFDQSTYHLVPRDVLWDFLGSTIDGNVGEYKIVKDWLWYIFAVTMDTDDSEVDELDTPNSSLADDCSAQLTEDEKIEADITDLLGENGDKSIGFFIRCREGVMDHFGQIVDSDTVHATAITRIDGQSITECIDPKYNTSAKNDWLNTEDTDDDSDDPADQWKRDI